MITKTDCCVVGAGAAGLTCAYHLQKAGLQVKVLEAGNQIGGRIRQDDALSDFPIDGGAEWIHGKIDKILNPIVDFDVASEVKTIQDNSGSGQWSRIWTGSTFREFYWPKCWSTDKNDNTWVDSTWYQFFDRHVAQNIHSGSIVLNEQVKCIDFRDGESEEGKDDGKNGIPTSKVICASGNIYEATYVVVTVSMQVLQNEEIEFVPGLSRNKKHAINQYRMGDAIKVFLKFKSNFYGDDFIVSKDLLNYSFLRESSANFAQREFWDETYGQTTDENVLGMFCYGKLCHQYIELYEKGGDEAVVDNILTELDSMFDGQASKQHIKSSVHMWPKQEFIKTGYVSWIHNEEDTVEVMQRPLRYRKVFFAGEAIPVDRSQWGYVHGAAWSGKDVARKIIELERTGDFKPTNVAWSWCSVS